MRLGAVFLYGEGVGSQRGGGGGVPASSCLGLEGLLYCFFLLAAAIAASLKDWRGAVGDTMGFEKVAKIKMRKR